MSQNLSHWFRKVITQTIEVRSLDDAAVYGELAWRSLGILLSHILEVMSESIKLLT
jgi:hypothetical protein